MARPTNCEKTIKGGCCQVATSRSHSNIFYEPTHHQLLQHAHIVALWTLLWPSLCRKRGTWEIMFRKIQHFQEICFQEPKQSTRAQNATSYDGSPEQAQVRYGLHNFFCAVMSFTRLWWFSGAGTNAQTPLPRWRLVCYGLQKIASFLRLCPLPGYDGSPEQAQMHKLLYTGCV